MLQFQHLLQQLGGTAQLKLPAYYQGLLLSLAAVNDVVSYSPDTLLLAALADDIFKRESFRELPFSFSAPTLSSQCCQHQLEVIISAVNPQVTPTLLP